VDCHKADAAEQAAWRSSGKRPKKLVANRARIGADMLGDPSVDLVPLAG
jgi:hypothetical protein